LIILPFAGQRHWMADLAAMGGGLWGFLLVKDFELTRTGCDRLSGTGCGAIFCFFGAGLTAETSVLPASDKL
jgi:hypothetical protein